MMTQEDVPEAVPVPRNDNLVEWTLLWVSATMLINEYTPNEIKQHLVYKRAQLATMTPDSIARGILMELPAGTLSGPH